MVHPECRFNPEGKRSLGDKLAITCRVADCAIDPDDQARYYIAHGDAGIIDEVREKAAPDCIINQPPEPVPTEAPPTEQQ